MIKENLLAALRSKLAEQTQSSEEDLRGGFSVIPGSGISPLDSGNSNCSNNRAGCDKNKNCTGNTACKQNSNCFGNTICNGNCNCDTLANSEPSLSDDILSFGNSL